jgi:hypothetical protein
MYLHGLGEFKINTVDYCATSPLDPSCGNTQNNPTNMILNSGIFHSPGYTPSTVTTPGSTPGQHVTTTTPVVTGNIFSAAGSASWYKTWWGLGLIGLAGFLGYKKFIAKK